jgi:hypothetical protein
MSDISELLERFRRGPELVAALMTGAAGPELDFVSAPGKWSLRQIVAHLSDCEIVYSDRFRRVAAEDNPTLIAFDQEAWAAKLNYAHRKTSESLETFRRLRHENYDLLKELPEAVFERTGNHSQRGTVTLRELVEGSASHAEGHARQVKEVREAYKSSRAAKA